jgi:hypothetical protein
MSLPTGQRHQYIPAEAFEGLFVEAMATGECLQTVNTRKAVVNYRA